MRLTSGTRLPGLPPGGTGCAPSGTAHSFTPIVETDVLLDTAPMRGIIEVDRDRLTVRAGPKTTIGDFGEPLWEHGLALANQGDIDTQAIAGAIATATHGSGLRQPSFSAALAGARLVNGTGEMMEVSSEVNAGDLPGAPDLDRDARNHDRGHPSGRPRL